MVPAIEDLEARQLLSALPVVSLVGVDKVAHEPGNGNAADTGLLKVSRTGSTSRKLFVKYAVSGTATNGKDYARLSGGVYIPAGLKSATITVRPLPDKIKEPRETVVLTLKTSSTYTRGKAKASTVSLYEAPAAPQAGPSTVTIVATQPSAAEPSTNGTFTLDRTGSTAKGLWAYYTVSGTAVGGTDYTALSGKAWFAAGQSSVNYALKPINNNTVDGTRTVTLTMNSSTAYKLGAAKTADLSIADNDISLASYFPFVAGASYTYYNAQNWPDERYEITTADGGLKNGVSTIAYTEHNLMKGASSTFYYSMDAQGLKLQYANVKNSGTPNVSIPYTAAYTTPELILPAVLDIGVTKTYTATYTKVDVLDQTSTMHVTRTLTAVGPEDLNIGGTIYHTLKVESLDTTTGDGQLHHDERWYYLAPGIGIVKQNNASDVADPDGSNATSNGQSRPLMTAYTLP
jgi:hypothetical protein